MEHRCRMVARGVALLCAVFLVSCAAHQSALQTEYKVGYTSKQLAEAGYKAIFTAYQAGRVNDVDMARADEAYAVWAVAQKHFVAAARDQQRGVDSKAIVMRNALAALLDLAAQLGRM